MKTFTSGRWALGAAAMLVVAVFAFSTRPPNGAIGYVGLPDGAAGLIARYVIEEKMGAPVARTVRFESQLIYDCCAGAAQYALGAGHVDMAILCVDAARALVARDGRYAIVGPVIQNSDVFVVRADAARPPLAIAVSQKRVFQRRMVVRRYGDRCRPTPMLHTAVPFAYARGVVQGAVVDVVKAFGLKGCYAAADNGVATYVLVAKKTVMTRDAFRRFMDYYDRAVLEMTDPQRLLHLLKTYASDTFTMEEVRQWKKLKVTFLRPLPVPRHRPASIPAS